MRTLLVTISLCLLLLAGAASSRAGMQSAREQEIQAAFLVKFVSYINWPSGTFTGANDPVVIGIYGGDPFGSTIDRIARSHVANGRHVLVRRCLALDQSCACNLLFIVPAAMPQMDALLAGVTGRPVVLVGNAPGFLEKGGMINFVKAGSKIRFEINKTALDKAGLKISSKLLKVAQSIR